MPSTTSAAASLPAGGLSPSCKRPVWRRGLASCLVRRPTHLGAPLGSEPAGARRRPRGAAVDAGRKTRRGCMGRVFDLDMATCPLCRRGSLRIIAAITQASVITRILRHLKLASVPPPIAPARLRQQTFDWVA